MVVAVDIRMVTMMTSTAMMMLLTIIVMTRMMFVRGGVDDVAAGDGYDDVGDDDV